MIIISYLISRVGALRQVCCISMRNGCVREHQVLKSLHVIQFIFFALVRCNLAVGLFQESLQLFLSHSWFVALLLLRYAAFCEDF